MECSDEDDPGIGLTAGQLTEAMSVTDAGPEPVRLQPRTFIVPAGSEDEDNN